MKSIAAALGLALLCSACGPATPAPDADWPEGALLSARTETLRSLLEGLAKQPTTPLGRSARAWLSALPDCPEVEAQAPSGKLADLPAALRCAGEVSGTAGMSGFRAWRGADALALALPVHTASRLRLRGRERDRDLVVDVAWPEAPTSGLLGSLLPGDEPAGPSVLAHRHAVVHAQARAEGPLDLATLAPEGSQGDQLFRLRSELFGAAVLDGRWELALYPPNDGQSMPQAVVALGIGLEALAERALDAFISELETTWHLTRTSARFGDASGACLLELTVLPDFAPCAVATRGAVLVGWNGASLRTALAGPPTGSGESVPGRLTLDLDALRATDERLALGNAAGEDIATVDWPWQRVRVDARRRAGELAVQLELVAPAATASHGTAASGVPAS